jgi:hypothetical protein
VLGAIGSGERSFSAIRRAAGDLGHASLNRSIQLLLAKGMVDVTLPLSTQPSKESRYVVADPHLRFWLAFVGPFQPELDRGRGDLLLRRIRAGWTAWRGREGGRARGPRIPAAGGRRAASRGDRDGGRLLDPEQRRRDRPRGRRP